MAAKLGEVGTFRQAPYSELVICPRCNDTLLPIGYPGALSRVDNETEICSPCGTDEGLRDYFGLRPMFIGEWPIPLRIFNVIASPDSPFHTEWTI